MKVAGLFAGIGGFEVGFDEAGHATLLTCENHAPAVSVLRHRLDADNHDDVRTLRSLPAATEVLCAGFPCQDLSQAGRTAGIQGGRSGLIGEVFRLLERRRVPWVVLENVPFMLQLQKGRALDAIVTRLEELGYRWAYRILDSLHFGLPQRRQRVFLIASTEGDPADVLLADEAPASTPETRLGAIAHGFYWTEGVRGLGWAADAVPTLKNGSTVGIPSPPAILLPDGRLIKPDIRDAERLQGFAPDWTAPATEAGRASWRWSLVGNAVSVPVARWVGERLAHPGTYDPARDRALDGVRWPKAARGDRSSRHAVQIGTAAITVGRPHLHAFLEHPGQDLSIRATAGFLTRTRRSSLRFPEGFLPTVSAHLDRMRAVAGLTAAAAE